ncbi:MAG: IclR family transcriptional regulator [Sneathiella sp.]|nr:IclR family transcriptional regulator [Sneathiella sp.]
MGDDKKSAAGSTLQTVQRAVEVLRCFEGGEKSLSLGELTKILGLNKVTVFRLANTLAVEGLLAYDKEKARYRVSFGLVTLGRKLLDLDGLRDSAHQAMEDARSLTNETICLSIQERGEQVVVYSLASQQPVRYVLEIGSRGSIFNGAAGQCLLVSKTQAELEKMLEGTGFSNTTDHSITNMDALLDKIKYINTHGYGISHGERIAEAAAAAAPIYAPDRSVVGVVSIVMPENRANQKLLDECGEIATKTAKKISEEFGRSR